MRLFLLLLLSMGCGASVLGQLPWKNVDTAFGPLPASLHVFRWTDSLDGHPFIAYYVSAVLKDKKLLFTDQTGQTKRWTPSQYYQFEQLPLVVVNCTFFSFETNQNLNMVMKDGKLVAYSIVSLRGTGPDSLLYYYPTRSAIGIDRQRKADVAWIYTDSTHRKPYAFENAPVIAKGQEKAPSIYDLKDIEWKWWKERTAVGGGPVLIHDGRIRITNKEEQLFPHGENDKHPRTAMGYTRDGRLIILAIQGRFPGIAEGATLEQEARLLLQLGCYEALNLDGGGSSCLLVNGKQTIKPSDKEGERPVPAVFLIKSAKP
ncbi:MAG TPA: phosphodiester glycosidase family protein [Puia sp.]|nr:phosphodiester glycosidase family protein [Puia sp.]